MKKILKKKKFRLAANWFCEGVSKKEGREREEGERTELTYSNRVYSNLMRELNREQRHGVSVAKA